MKTLKLTLLAVAVAVCAGCGKNQMKDMNPAEVETPAAAFTLTAVETRGLSGDFDWTISQSGVTDSVNEEVDDMYVTAFNSVVVTVTPEQEGAFDGFNVRSSNPNAVKVTPLDKHSFEMKRPFGGSVDGEATVEVWNGSGAAQQKVSFKVKSVKVVEATHMVFLVDGKEVLVPVSNSIEEAQAHYDNHIAEHVVLIMPESEKTPNWDESLRNSNDWDDIIVHEIVIKCAYPENSSYDYIEVKQHAGATALWLQLLEGRGLEYTGSEFKGSISDFQNHNTCYVATHVSCTGFSIDTIFPIQFVISAQGAFIKYCFAARVREEDVTW
jgi:hypothetical protein